MHGGAASQSLLPLVAHPREGVTFSDFPCWAQVSPASGVLENTGQVEEVVLNFTAVFQRVNSFSMNLLITSSSDAAPLRLQVKAIRMRRPY